VDLVEGVAAALVGEAGPRAGGVLVVPYQPLPEKLEKSAGRVKGWGRIS
jgi:hypothetical protein